MWDEVAAATWIDPTLVLAAEDLVIDVELDRGPRWGDTLSWAPGTQPDLATGRARVEKHLDQTRFFQLFAELSSR